MEKQMQPKTLKEEIQKILGAFLQEEAGNKITSFSISGLFGALVTVIDKSENKKEKIEAPKEA
jgi:hypothetical protein